MLAQVFIKIISFVSLSYVLNALVSQKWNTLGLFVCETTQGTFMTFCSDIYDLQRMNIKVFCDALMTAAVAL